MVSLTEGDQLEQKLPGRDPGVDRSDVGDCFWGDKVHALWRQLAVGLEL